MYLYLGSVIRKNNVLQDIFSLPVYLKIAAFVIWILAAAFTGGFDIGSGSVGYSIVGFTISLIGSFYVLYFCKKTNISFGWIGRNTLSILCAHILVWRIFDIFDISVKNLSFHPYINFIIEVLCEVSLALLLGLIISKTHLLEFNKVKDSIVNHSK